MINVLIFIFALITISYAGDYFPDNLTKKGNTIHLIRHGEKVSQIPEEKFNYKREISEDGKTMANKIANFFYKKYENNDTILYVSPFWRCIQTAAPIAKELNIKMIIQYDFFEPFHGFPPLTEDEIARLYDGEYEIQAELEMNIYKELANPEIKNDSTSRQKVFKLRREIAKKLMIQKENNKDIIVVSHDDTSNAIGYFLEDPNRQFEELTKKQNEDMDAKWKVATIVEYYQIPVEKTQEMQYIEGNRYLYDMSECSTSNMYLVDKLKDENSENKLLELGYMTSKDPYSRPCVYFPEATSAAVKNHRELIEKYFPNLIRN